MVAVIIVYLVETLSHVLYTPPPGVDLSNPEQLASLIGELPVMALVFVVVAWILGAFGGALVAAPIARDARVSGALIVGGVMVLLVIANLLIIPHPIWMTIAGIVLPLPAAWLAAWLEPGCS
ncbi:MAG: hypothetical protein JSV80_16705 [Acidobacteriota bacterium]|nr:MAG: hypothetical protein JSV80_16705 [Acidobacteriota bacterium]